MTPSNSLLTPSQKRQNTKDLYEMAAVIADLFDQINNQYPQPNGDIYLHGEIITPSRVNRYIKWYNQCAEIWNTYKKPVLTMKETIGWSYFVANGRKRSS